MQTLRTPILALVLLLASLCAPLTASAQNAPARTFSDGTLTYSGELALAEFVAQAKPRLPEAIHRTLVDEVARYPWPVVQSDEHLGELLNWVAWQHRGSGVGLSRKTGGRHVESPVGPIAEDILQFQDGHHYDVLGAAKEGNPLLPGSCCPESIGVINVNARPWVAPVEHIPSWLRGTTPAPGPGPGQPAPPATTPAPDYRAVLQELLTATQRIEQRLTALEQAQANAPDLGLLNQYVDHMVGNGPGAPLPNHVTDLKQRLDVLHQHLEQLDAWLRGRRALRF
jgi:hypothetical protein